LILEFSANLYFCPHHSPSISSLIPKNMMDPQVVRKIEFKTCPKTMGTSNLFGAKIINWITTHNYINILHMWIKMHITPIVLKYQTNNVSGPSHSSRTYDNLASRLLWVQFMTRPWWMLLTYRISCIDSGCVNSSPYPFHDWSWASMSKWEITCFTHFHVAYITIINTFIKGT
jgi:hypothetical protein